MALTRQARIVWRRKPSKMCCLIVLTTLCLVQLVRVGFKCNISQRLATICNGGDLNQHSGIATKMDRRDHLDQHAVHVRRIAGWTRRELPPYKDRNPYKRIQTVENNYDKTAEADEHKSQIGNNEKNTFQQAKYDRAPVKHIYDSPFGKHPPRVGKAKKMNIQEFEYGQSAGRGIRDNTCEPTTNVAFIKVHKAGSSTITSIMQRFGYTRKLNFVLPIKNRKVNGYNYIGNPGDTITEDNIRPLPPNQSYNILCNHVTYNRNAFRRLLPTKTVYVAIVREPLTHFLAAFQFFEQSYYKSLQNPIELKPSFVLKDIGRVKRRNPYLTSINNRQSLDLGINYHRLDNSTYIKEFVESVKADFHMVLVMERFDESLILLKRMLCWSLEDVLYLKKNQRKEKVNFIMTNEDNTRVINLNKADSELYNYSMHKLNEMAEEAGEDFQSETLNFKSILKKVGTFCSEVDWVRNRTLRVGRSSWNREFLVTQKMCHELRMHELAYLELLMF